MVILPGMIETSDQWSVQFTDHGSAEKTTLKLTDRRFVNASFKTLAVFLHLKAVSSERFHCRNATVHNLSNISKNSTPFRHPCLLLPSQSDAPHQKDVFCLASLLVPVTGSVQQDSDGFGESQQKFYLNDMSTENSYQPLA